MVVNEQDPQQDCIKDVKVFVFSNPHSVLKRAVVSPNLGASLWRSPCLASSLITLSHTHIHTHIHNYTHFHPTPIQLFQELRLAPDPDTFRKEVAQQKAAKDTMEKDKANLQKMSVLKLLTCALFGG